MNKVMNKVLLKYSQHRTDLFSGVLLLEPTLNPMEMLQMISDTHDSSVFEWVGVHVVVVWGAAHHQPGLPGG